MRSPSRALLESGTSIAVAESLTGGLLAATIVDTPGISAIFRGGVVAYTPQIKSEVLGVDPGIIERHGVVSAQVAVAMARGVAELMGAERTVATTGVAGPGPDGTVPEGTVWIGDNDGRAYSLACGTGRDHIRRLAADIALEFLAFRRIGAELSQYVTQSWENPDKANG